MFNIVTLIPSVMLCEMFSIPSFFSSNFFLIYCFSFCIFLILIYHHSMFITCACFIGSSVGGSKNFFKIIHPWSGSWLTITKSWSGDYKNKYIFYRKWPSLKFWRWKIPPNVYEMFWNFFDWAKILNSKKENNREFYKNPGSRPWMNFITETLSSCSIRKTMLILKKFIVSPDDVAYCLIHIFIIFVFISGIFLLSLRTFTKFFETYHTYFKIH